MRLRSKQQAKKHVTIFGEGRFALVRSLGRGNWYVCWVATAEVGAGKFECGTHSQQEIRRRVAYIRGGPAATAKAAAARIAITTTIQIIALLACQREQGIPVARKPKDYYSQAKAAANTRFY